MIVLHRINGKEFVLNCELIRTVEATPDTVITLVNNEKMMVQEKVDEVIDRTLRYKQEVFRFPTKQEL